MKKVPIALFDIDKTIISKDSMFLLMQYTFKYHPSTRKDTLRFIGHGFKYALKKIDTKTVKEAAFSCIKALNHDDLKKYYQQYLYQYMYQDALDKMKELKAQGYIILLITASPEAYMQYFKEIEEVDDVIGTKLMESSTGFMNQIMGENCKGEEKVYRIMNWLKENDLEIDYENSYAFSDSMSDLPMFKLVKNSFIINNNKANYSSKLYWK